jgi:hypothetical protein
MEEWTFDEIVDVNSFQSIPLETEGTVDQPLKSVHVGARPLPRPVSTRRLTAWIGVFSFLCFAYFIPHWDWNQAARMDMTVAAVNHGTFAIDRYQDNTGDKDFFQGHYYSQKAPGQSLMGIPIYAAYVAFMDLKGTPPQDRADDFAAQYLLVQFTVAIPMALFLMMFFWFLGYFSRSLLNRVVVTLALGLATDMFPYAHELFGHVPEAVLLFALFVLAYIAGKGESAIRGPVTAYLVKNPDVTAWLFGLCFGFAFIFEYPPVTIAILIGLYALTRVPLRTVGWMAVGAASILVLMLAYNYAVYHNIRTVGYTSGSAAVIKGQLTQGFGGLVWPPTWNSLWSLSFGPYRGMIFLSPFLLLAFPGFRLWARRGGIEWLLFLLISILFWIELSMYLGWWGGMATGPRYLIPMLPFLTFPVIFFLDWMRTHRMSTTRLVVVYLLFALSLFNTWVMTLTGYAAENEINPLFSQAIPTLFQQNYVYNNRGNDLGLTGIQSLFPLFALLVLWTLLVFSPFLRRGLRTGRAMMRSLPVPGRYDRGDLVGEGASLTVPADTGGAMIVDSRDAH